MIQETKKEKDGASKEGWLRFKGREYLLLQMDADDIKTLDCEITEDLRLLKAMMQREDLDDIEGWEGEVAEQIRIRKSQLTAITIEFVRRKKQIQPLESFAWSAIYETMGLEALNQVKEKARELQELERVRRSAPNRKHVPVKFLEHVPAEEKMCGTEEKRKIKHTTVKSANEQLADMQAHGKSTKGMGVYPCHYCGSFHVGHNPRNAIWGGKKGE